MIILVSDIELIYLVDFKIEIQQSKTKPGPNSDRRSDNRKGVQPTNNNENLEIEVLKLLKN